MDSGDLVENGHLDPSPEDSANKVIDTSGAAEDAKKDDGDFLGAVCFYYVMFFYRSTVKTLETFNKFFLKLTWKT